MRRSRHPDSVTIGQARTQLTMLLAGCTDVALSAMTPEYLASTHKVPAKECEYMLTIERQRRARAA